MALFDPGEVAGRVGKDADRALTVPATPLRVDGPTGFDPSRTDFSLSDVLAWARTKPADEAYDYGDIHGCALCQFLSETGRASAPEVGGFTWDDAAAGARRGRPIPEPVADALHLGSRTFGAFADRLEQALAR